MNMSFISQYKILIIQGQKQNLLRPMGYVRDFTRLSKMSFYATAFRKKIYVTIEDLQEDAEKWVEEYNRERPHSGKYCYGKTPWQTFQESKHLAQAKMLDEMNLTEEVVR